MLFEHRILVQAPPERLFDFFEQIEEHYTTWHPDHILFRWVEGKGLHVGAKFYFEERIAGKLLTRTVRFTRVEHNRYLEFVPTWWLLRLLLPHLSFTFESQNHATLFIARLRVRTGPIGAALNKREFDAVRKHMREEGENLKRIVEKET